MSGKVVLISGCSSGFGRELAQEALGKGYRVIATARKPETLKDLEKQGAKALRLDVTSSEESLKGFAKEAVGLFGRVDILISNAGYLLGGAIEESTHEENLGQFMTNFFGVINLTNSLLPYMREQKSGIIVNISSQGGSLNIPGAGIYCASKAALDSISDTWSRELASFDIQCVSVQPGGFATDVAQSSNLKTATHEIDGYNAAHDWVKNFNTGAGKEPGDPRKAAKHILQLLEQKDLPRRFAIGDDASENLIEHHREQAKEYEAHVQLSTGTNRNNA